MSALSGGPRRFRWFLSCLFFKSEGVLLISDGFGVCNPFLYLRLNRALPGQPRERALPRNDLRSRSGGFPVASWLRPCRRPRLRHSAKTSPPIAAIASGESRPSAVSVGESPAEEGLAGTRCFSRRIWVAPHPPPPSTPSHSHVHACPSFPLKKYNPAGIRYCSCRASALCR